MQVKKQRIAVALVAAGPGLANAGVQAREPIPPNENQGRTSETERDTSKPQDAEFYNRPDHSKPADTKHGQQIRASKLIGKEVKSEQGERLGKVEDLIINSSYTVNFAIISSRGALGLGDKHIAVPIKDLNCSGEGITLSATADQLKNASKTPTGGWMAVSGEEWTRDIDGYYGQPQEFSMTGPRRFSSSDRTFERDQFDAALEREPVRAVQGDGARQLITHPDHANLFDEPLIGNEPTGNSHPSVPTPSDETMQQRISDSLQQIYPSSAPEAVSVTVQDGVVTLRGTVANATEKRNIETTVKQTSGVRRVNNQLTVQSR
jgi:sporulation protein YlmC with PRC-barrel domain